MKPTKSPCVRSILLWASLLILVACNNASTDNQTTADSAVPAAVDTMTPPINPGNTGGVTRDTPTTTATRPARPHPVTARPVTARPVKAKPPVRGVVPRDTIAVEPGPVPVQKKNAFLGYSYPLLVPRGETRNINAYVTIRNSTSFIKDTLKEIIIDQQGEYSEKKDTIVIFPNNILFYKSLQVTLLDPSNDFTIVRIHNTDSQEVDTINGNRWQWSITTRSSKKVATLLLKAVGMGRDGTPDKFDDKNIPIRIAIDPTITRGFFNYLTDNPAISVPIIVAFLGFIGWLIKWWLGKKKEE